VATSREPLRIAGEITYPVQPMSLPEEDVSLGELQDAEAGRLFLQRAREAQPDFEFNESNRMPVIQICRRLDGIPLAIELAIALLRVMTPKEISERLESRFEILKRGRRTALPRQQTLLGTIEWSYNLLSEEERILFNRLSLFIGGFTLLSAETVCADERVPREEFLDLTTNLVEKSLLLTTEDPGGTTRYRMLDSIRHYGLKRLEQACETEVFQHRFAEYYREFAVEAEANLYGPDQVGWYDRLQSEYANIREVLRWSLDQDEIEIGLDIAGRIAEYWRVRGVPSEGVRWFERLLELYPSDITNTHAIAVVGLGWLEFGFAKVGIARSLETLEKGLRFHRALGNQWRVAKALLFAGEVRKSSGDVEGAYEYLEEAISLGKEVGDQWVVAEALIILAQLPGNPDAERFVMEALEIHRRIGNIMGIAWALDNLGSQLWQRGDWLEAMPLIEESIDNYREVGSKADLAFAVQSSMLWISKMKGEYAQAITHLREARMIFCDIGDHAGNAYTFLLESEVLHLQEKFEEARSRIDESLNMFRRLPEQGVIGQVLSHSGKVLRDVGEYVLAEKRCMEGQEWYLKYNQRRLMGMNSIILGELALRLGKVEEAKDRYQEGLDLIRGFPAVALIEHLESIGQLFFSLQLHSPIARVYGALDGFREEKQIVLHPIEKSRRKEPMESAHSVLGEEEFLKHYSEGRGMDLDRVIEFSLGVLRKI